MKKLLLTGLLFAFAGISLAETPKIVNPPRPTRKFKLLVLLEHEVLERAAGNNCRKTYHTHFIYTDAYHLYDTGDSVDLISDTDFQEFSIGNGYFEESNPQISEAGSPGSVRPINTLAVETTKFFKAKAPEPKSVQALNIKSRPPTPQPPRHQIKPQKAKVVFTK